MKANPGLQGMWVLSDLPGEALTAESFENGHVPIMEINMQDSTLSGNGGCNSFHGQFSIVDGRFIPGDLMSTKRYCGENNREPDFFNALQGSFEVDIENHTLYLMQDDQFILTFRRAAEID